MSAAGSTSDSDGNEELTIFRQYIHHIPPKHAIHFGRRFRHIDFILSFAVEKGDGLFIPTWKVDPTSIQWVKTLKVNHPEVRVVISIGGVGSEFPFNPVVEKDKWISNAVETIKNIILLYEHGHSFKKTKTIDGIDIHYDVIKSSEDDFSYCIGQVIKHLKNDTSLLINVVSIAPTKLVQHYYLKLYKDNKHNIQLVDYQFYNQKFYSVEEVVDLYKSLVIDYNPAKVLAGIGIPGDPVIRDGIKYLINHKLLPGIFFWFLFDSLDGPNTFSIEKFLQDLF